MQVCCLSDIHGFLPAIPDCDLLLLGGDYCWNHDDHKWYDNQFGEWLESIHNRGITIAGVAGNHDFIFERKASPTIASRPCWNYLQDSGITWKGLNIWGSPWQPRFYDWAFNEDEPQLEKIWAKIPDNTDILVLHGPPQGFGDLTVDNRRTGSPSLTQRIIEVKPKLVVCGHIHCSYGHYHIGDTLVVNASYVNEDYRPAHEPVAFALEV